MPNLENLTHFIAIDLPSLTRHSQHVLAICVMGRFALPRPGRPSPAAPEREEAPPPSMM
jgi:hypothetical protein